MDSGATSGTAQSAFPVTIEHRYGSTDIPAPPERIVTVRLTDHDEDGNYFPYGPTDARARFLSDLGFAQQPEIARLAGDQFYNNVLSLPFAIDGMMPLLQAAVGGDPNTAVPAA